MRLWVAALALFACHRAPGPATPTNKVPEPDYRAAAADELAFLPIDSEFVIGVDFAAIRTSQMWSSFKPQIDAFVRKVPELGGACGTDLLSAVERVTMGLKIPSEDKVSGVIVVHGGDMSRALDCTVSEARKKGGTVTVDRGATITTNPSLPNMAAASLVIGGSTMVMNVQPGATRDTLVKALDAGAPLRHSAVFMKMFDRRERGSSLWGIANGSAKAFAELARSGFRPSSIDGTIVVNDRLAIALRMTMGSPAEASALQTEIDKVKGPIGNYVERFGSRADGDVITIELVVTSAQLRAMWSLLGGAMGP